MSNARELAELGGSYGSGGFVGMKNRIINGAMMIDQRNAGASVSNPASKQYVLDRWAFWTNGSSGSAAFTVQQSSVAPAGFSNSILITQTAAFSPSGTQHNLMAQYIEGYSVADLGWGTASAQSVTLSFWVRSSLTGTFGGAFSNSAQDRSYAFTYTINSANTWEQKTITVVGDTSGTWQKTTSTGLQIYWQIGVGSGYLGAAGSWAGATYLGATGTTNFTATNGATLYITGVQLEKGSTATSFDYRPYGTELQLCQRYCQVLRAPSGSNPYARFGIGVGQSTTTAHINYFPSVWMRAIPTLSTSSASTFAVYDGVTVTALTIVVVDGDTSPYEFSFAVAAASGLTATRPYELVANNNNTAFAAFSAEL